MIIPWLLFGSILCALSITLMAFLIGGFINPKTASTTLCVNHVIYMALTLAAIILPARFIIMNYQQVFEYSEPVRYVTFGLIGSTLILPTGFLMAVIADTIISLVRKTRYQ